MKVAYLVFHDAFGHGAMDVWFYSSFDAACAAAIMNQDLLDNSGFEECGFWTAYEELPTDCRIRKIYLPKNTFINTVLKAH